MKKIGIIGGMSFESTIEYYRIINEEIQKKLGGLHSAYIILDSYDFDEIVRLQSSDDWDKLTNIMTNSAKKLESYGADCILIATNTMHKVAPWIDGAVNIPLIHIIDSTASAIKKAGYKKVGLLGTKYTMSESFYKGNLKDDYNIDSVVPDDSEQDIVHKIIFEELCAGKIFDSSREKLNEIIKKLQNKGAEAVVLGCTELPNIIKSAPIPIINTLEAHCTSAVDFALSGKFEIFK